MNKWAKEVLAELPSEEALKVPKPGGETKSKYMRRCMKDGYMKRKFPRIDQRVAVCLTTWEG
jgi:hypothetical protein